MFFFFQSSNSELTETELKIQVVSDIFVFQKVSAISFFKKRNRVIEIIKLGEMQIGKKACKKIENCKIFEQSIFIHVEYVLELCVCCLGYYYVWKWFYPMPGQIKLNSKDLTVKVENLIQACHKSLLFSPLSLLIGLIDRFNWHFLMQKIGKHSFKNALWKWRYSDLF